MHANAERQFRRVSIHAPRAGRDEMPLSVRKRGQVSIHAPRAGRDTRGYTTDAGRSSFNPRAPRGARQYRNAAEGVPTCFNPRAPRGARLHSSCRHITPHAVSIHAPRAGRDLQRDTPPEYKAVSIHAPRAGRDRARGHDERGMDGFNPRAPRGARHTLERMPDAGPMFQSTRPARGATTARQAVRRDRRVSIHAPRAGRDRTAACSTLPH